MRGIRYFFISFWLFIGCFTAHAALDKRTGNYFGYSYELHSPNTASPKNKRPLVVALHGCKMTASDFLEGSRLLQYAESGEFYVLAPQQSRLFNYDGCWNFFMDMNQQRHSNFELGALRSIIDIAIQNNDVDRENIYIVGMSSGAGMALNLTYCFPEVFSGGAYFSGGAFAGAKGVSNIDEYLMDGSSLHREELSELAYGCYQPQSEELKFKTGIVVHGDIDQRIFPVHGNQVFHQMEGFFERISPYDSGDKSQQFIEPDGKHSFTVKTSTLKSLGSRVDYYTIHGMAHYISGGQQGARYTDPRGPNMTLMSLQKFGLLE